MTQALVKAADFHRWQSDSLPKIGAYVPFQLRGRQYEILLGLADALFASYLGRKS